MALIYARTRLAVAAAGVALAASACTVHKTEVPALTGPSGFGNSIVVSVSPNVLSQDGQSQSIVTITATDSFGNPARNIPMRVDITVDGAVTDFGRLSAKSVVTDASGRAGVIYTAPAQGNIIVNNGTKIEIQVTPTDSTFNSNFDNTTPRTASILLVPPGIIPGPPSTLVPSFTVPALNVGDPGVFSAVVVDASGANAINQVGSFQWNFGDGGTGSGQTVTHTFTRIGTFPVTLTITDSVGRTNFVTQSITIGQGQLPIAAFTVSPQPPAVIGQTLNFNGSGSTAAPGHFLADFAWDFGDGKTSGGVSTTHAYTQTGTFIASLIVTDDAGRKSALFPQTIVVNEGNPTPDFTFTPSSPKSGEQVTFDASPTTASAGRTIVSWSWSFGTTLASPPSGTGQSVRTTYTIGSTSQTFNVLLTVTDSAGKTASITKPITIQP